jgi:lipid-A-disaccharide synthase
MTSPVPVPEKFEPPAAGTADVLFVAGEHSGSDHAARVIRELRARHPALRIAALGGESMCAAGAQLLFDMTRFSAVGLVEVLANFGFYRRLFSRTVAWIREHKPRLVVLVDYPGFNLRLADRLRSEGLSRKGGGHTAVCQYISPQIWAWKAGRRFKMARDLDGLGVIFPFEVACYADTNLPVRFVGHPFVADDFALPVRYDADAPVLLLPGSRPKPVRKIFPVLLEAWQKFLEGAGGDAGKRTAVVQHTGEPVLSVLREVLAKFPKVAKSVRLVERAQNEQVKNAAGTAGSGALSATGTAGALRTSGALSSSGTMSLSLALAGVPGAIVYRANPITWFVGRRLVKGVEYLGIANILLKRPAWPEYLQSDANPDALAARLAACLNEPAAALAAQNDAAALRELLGGDQQDTPSAAQWLEEFL